MAKGKRPAAIAIDDPAEATPAAIDAVAIDVAAPSGMTTLLHADITPDPENARKHFEPDAIADLADSIADRGLLQNLVVGEDNVLIAGERRWRAIGLLIERGDWPADRPIAVNRVAGLTDSDRAIAALLENLQRIDLKPLEEARAFKALREVHGLETDDIAGRIRRSRRLVQQRLQLLTLSPEEQVQLDEGKITVEDARRLAAAKPKPVELTPLQLLALLELTHKISQEPEPKNQYDWRETEVDATASAQDFPANLFLISRKWNTGRSYARFDTYNSPREITLDAWAPRWRDDIWRAIAVACDAIPEADLPPNKGLYRTPWLNGQFEVPADVRERLEADERAREENAAQWADRLAEENREHERRQAAGAKAQRLADDWTAPFQAFALREVMTETGHPLPWTYVEETEEADGGLVDANGDDVPLEDLIYQPGFDRIFANLLNDAVRDPAGAATPEAEAPAEAQLGTDVVPGFLRRLAS